MKSLNVLVDGKLVGTLHNRDPLAFIYSDDCLSGLLPNPFANVIGLAAGAIATPAVLAYFENLLPEGDQRRALEQQHHVTTVFGLLSKAGWDTAGAVVLRPAGAADAKPAYTPKSWADIARMIAKLDEGYDLVHGWRRDRKDALVSRKIPSRIANWLIARVTRFPINDLGCTLKAMRRDILSEIELYGDMHRFIPILLYKRGARCAEVVTNHRPRVAGVTKYGIGRTLVVLLDLVTVKFMLDYAAHPMRLFGGLALVGGAVSVLSFVVMILMKYAGDVDFTGNPLLLLTAISGLAGLQFLCFGIIGEVLARLYFTRGNRLQYAVRETINISDSAV